MLLIMALAAGAALGPSLSGCGVQPGGDGITGLFDRNHGAEVFSEDSNRQLARFERAIKKNASAEDADSEKLNGQLAHFRDAFLLVRRDYVHNIADAVLIDAALKGVDDIQAKDETKTTDPGKLVEAGLNSMLVSLDPHSSYMNQQELNEMKITNRGEFGGLGIEVTMQDGFVKVVAPIENTPASRAGLKSGDLITHIDGGPVQGMTLLQAVRTMRGKPDTPINLTISRADLAPFDVRIVRAVIKVQAVRWHLEGTIGYVRVTNFSEKVGPGIARAMGDIHKQLGSQLTGYVLDLRNNPGGLLQQSLSLSDAFLEKGTIVSVRGRRPGSERLFKAEAGDLAFGKPLVVLINSGSASASEIVAGALQDQGRAIVMGQRSFGKGSVQTIIPLPREGALRLTTQLYYSPSGRAIQARGIDPDIEIIPIPDPEAEKAAAKAAEDKAATKADNGTDEAASLIISHEADLPGALDAVGDEIDHSAHDHTHTHASLPEESCQPVGEKEDRQLGCALALLRAGSTQEFLASMGQSPAM